MSRFAPTALIIGVLAVAAAAGCATAISGPSPAPSEPDPTPPTATTEPPVATNGSDSADPASWIIEDGELGPIELGDDFDETLAELPDDWAPVEGCEAVASWNGDEEFGVFFVRGEQGTIETVVVEGGLGDPAGGPRTEGGIGLGSTRDEVRSAYPTSEEVPATIGGATYLRYADDDPDDGAAFFEIAEGDDRVSTIALTTRDEPPYEPCA